MGLRWPSDLFDVSPDVLDVVAASNALDIREFRLFQIAYTTWFGRDGSETDIERPFMRYLRTEQAPIWVRHFTREVLTRKRQGRLDPRDFGLAPVARAEVDPRVQAAMRFVLYAAWGVMIGVLAFGIAG